MEWRSTVRLAFAAAALCAGCRAEPDGSTGPAPVAAGASSRPSPEIQERPAEGAWTTARVALTKESGPLRCEVRTIGRWARLGCRAGDASKPPVFALRKGNSADLFESSGEVGVHYLLADGQHVVAEITSGTDWIKFGYEWPVGADEPAAVGVF